MPDLTLTRVPGDWPAQSGRWAGVPAGSSWSSPAAPAGIEAGGDEQDGTGRESRAPSGQFMERPPCAAALVAAAQDLAEVLSVAEERVSGPASGRVPGVGSEKGRTVVHADAFAEFDDGHGQARLHQPG